jgi:hypothetical protein
MLDGLGEPQVNPAGTVSVRETVPVKPLTAVTVIVDVSAVKIVAGAGEVAEIMKSGPLPKVAVCAVSGTGVTAPLAMSMQVVVPPMLLGLQPV